MIITRPCKGTLWCLRCVTSEAFHSIFSPSTACLLRSGKGKEDPRGKGQTLGHSLGIAKGWGFLKAFFLNWDGFLHKAPALRTGFYLLTKRQKEDRGEKSIPCSGMPGCCGGLLPSVLQGKFWFMLTDVSKLHFQFRYLNKSLKRENVFLLNLDPR